MSSSLCQLLELSLLLISTPKAKETLLKPLVPSHTAARLRTARAKYRERNKEVEAEKARIRMSRYRAKIKANRHATEEYRQLALGHDAAYKAKNREFLAWKAKVTRINKSDPKKLAERGVMRESSRDYEVEWEVYKARRHEERQDELRRKVADVLYIPAADERRICQIVDLTSLTFSMAESSPYYCSPPFHPDPGTSKAGKFVYLVTCPGARSPGPGIYPSWLSAQRVVTGIPHGMAVSNPSIQACLPAWHAGCDAGEHDHPASPDVQRANISSGPRYTPQTPQTPRKATTILLPASPSTGRGNGRIKTPASKLGVRVAATASSSPIANTHVPTAGTALIATTAVSTHATATPAHVAVLGNSFAVRGGGVVHSSLTAALEQYQAAAIAGATSVCTMTDARTAVYFAAGHSMDEALAMATGERVVMMYERWAQGPSGESAVCRLRRDELVERLTAALDALRVGDVAPPDYTPEDSDVEDLSDDECSSKLTYISD
ncbi:hypothetical protein C8R44DRAFT_873790 [Mycena epipterygia]|nr:hypothetical protein C8R44DRAFT_873790 [Mycena epipterygia]